jgi:hypothetical protein
MNTENLFSEKEIIDVGDIFCSIITELRGFESRFSTKIESIHNYWRNHFMIEKLLDDCSEKMLKAKCGLYMDDSLTSLYPYIIHNQMFFLKCSKVINNYNDFILNNIQSSKKGLEITKTKLSNPKFIEKAPEEILNIERKKEIDFGYKWELWTKAFLLYENI